MEFFAFFQVLSVEEVQENQENLKPVSNTQKRPTAAAPPGVKEVRDNFLINEDCSVGDVDFFQRHCIETRDLMDVESNIPKSDPTSPTKQVEQASFLDVRKKLKAEKTQNSS